MNSKSNKLPACIYRLALALVFAAFVLSPSYAVNVTVGWDPNDEPDLEGYKVYHNIGDPGPPYKYRTTLPETKLDDPLNPMVTLTGLKEDTNYYVAVTAYNTNGNESRYSNDVCVQIVDSALELCGSSLSSTSSPDSGGGGGGGGGGGFCFISTAGSKTACSIEGLFFQSQPTVPFFSLLFLLLIAATSSIALKILKALPLIKLIG